MLRDLPPLALPLAAGSPAAVLVRRRGDVPGRAAVRGVAVTGSAALAAPVDCDHATEYGHLHAAMTCARFRKVAVVAAHVYDRRILWFRGASAMDSEVCECGLVSCSADQLLTSWVRAQAYLYKHEDAANELRDEQWREVRAELDLQCWMTHQAYKIARDACQLRAKEWTCA